MKLKATGQTLELVEPERLVSGSVEIYTAAFEFDAAWDGYAKTAVFRDDSHCTVEVALTGNCCTVPWEILRAGKYIHVGVYGVNGGKRYPTIYTANGFRVLDGALPANPSQPPSPTEYEQLLSMIGDTAALKTTDKSSLVAAINEIYQAGGGGQSVTDARVDDNGDLIITLSDGNTLNAGHVVGAQGPAGADGVGLPTVTAEDNGMYAGVVDGAWGKVSAPGGGGEWTLLWEHTFSESDVGTAYWEWNVPDITEISVRTWGLQSNQTMGWQLKVNGANLTNNVAVRDTDGIKHQIIHAIFAGAHWITRISTYDYDAMSASSLNNTASPTGANMGDGKAQTIQFAQSAVQDYQIYSGQVKIWVR